jgi:glycosyltransferase involved in cell wall biosynthesis
VKRSDIVTVQHPGQKLKKKPRGKTVLFSNILDFRNIGQPAPDAQDYYVHVGTLSALKGSENLLNLAKTVNGNTRISIIGTARGAKSRSQEIYEELRHLEHVELKGRKDHAETLRLIGGSKALINTSFFEGFPNVFLEAWAQGVPVVSLNVNPGNVINQYRLGVCCNGDLEKMKQVIEQDETSAIDRQALINYTRNFHDFETAADRFLAILEGRGEGRLIRV